MTTTIQPRPLTQIEQGSPIISPDEVRIGGRVEARPDRVFYVLDPSNPYADVVWEIDGYTIEDVPGRASWRLHLICPVCDRGLTLESTKKQLEVSDRGLEVETFQCAWEGDFSSPRCTFVAGIRPPRNEAERTVRCDGAWRPTRIDGVFVRNKRR